MLEKLNQIEPNPSNLNSTKVSKKTGVQLILLE
jgi:hypothetical protein